MIIHYGRVWEIGIGFNGIYVCQTVNTNCFSWTQPLAFELTWDRGIYLVLHCTLNKH